MSVVKSKKYKRKQKQKKKNHANYYSNYYNCNYCLHIKTKQKKSKQNLLLKKEEKTNTKSARDLFVFLEF